MGKSGTLAATEGKERQAERLQIRGRKLAGKRREEQEEEEEVGEEAVEFSPHKHLTFLD